MKDLERVVTDLAKAKPVKVYPLLHQAFVVFAGAGEFARAGSIIRLAYDARLPRPSKPVDFLGTGPMDAVCVVAELGDLTKGEPVAKHLAGANGLTARVKAGERFVRGRIVREKWSNRPRPSGHWSGLDGIDLWLTVQRLAAGGNTDEAFPALTKYMDAWCASPDDRGAGYGDEILMAIDLAVLHGATDHLERWISAVGRHLFHASFHIPEALCLTTAAGAIGNGLLAPLLGLPAQEAERRFRAIEAAVAQLIAAPDVPDEHDPTKPVRRQVSAPYSQFSLEHATSPDGEVFFQDARENAQGMSIFGSKVGIATPGETATCTVTIRLRPDAPADGVEDAVQAVAFPFTVAGPLFVRSVFGDDDEDDEVVLPHGAYDVLARFFPARASKADAEAGLRVFRVALDFHRSGSLEAPRCLKLEERAPSETIFVQGR